MTTVRNRQLLVETLRRITDMLAGDRDLERIYAGILDCALQVMGAEAACLVVRDEDELVRAVRWRPQIGQGTELDRFPYLASGLFGEVMDSHRMVMTDRSRCESRFDPEADAVPGLKVVNLVGVPFSVRGSTPGALVVWNASRLAEEGAEELDILEVLASQAAVAAENFRLYKRLEQLAITDELTQVFNYRYLKSALRKEVRQATRLNQRFSILMVDVDHLKGYNERFGHLCGSALLRTVASLLYQNCRKDHDIVAKYGGDEFLIILPRTGQIGAMAMANRVRVAVEKERFPHVEPGQITITVGIAEFPLHGATVDDLIAVADTALYTAKRGGRNRVLVAPGRGDEAAPDVAA